jgi:hypothetical protein
MFLSFLLIFIDSHHGFRKELAVAFARTLRSCPARVTGGSGANISASDIICTEAYPVVFFAGGKRCAVACTLPNTRGKRGYGNFVTIFVS